MPRRHWKKEPLGLLVVTVILWAVAFVATLVWGWWFVGPLVASVLLFALIGWRSRGN